MSERFPITPEGYKRLSDELHSLKNVERPAIINAIAEARSHGDLSENAEYQAAREKQSFIESKIADLEDKAARAEVIDITKISGDKIKFGATVDLIDEETEEEMQYKIVGDYESNVEKGFLSVSSPLAKALLGKSEGDSVEVFTPKGRKYYEILSLKYV